MDRSNNEILMNRAQIMEVLPHRDPFLFVDEVMEMEVGKSVKAIKYVQEEEYYFKGHFPQEKVMPGVLIIEALAQAGGIGVLSMPENSGKLAYLGGVKNAKFRQKVVPGDILTLEVTLDKIKARAGIGTGTAYVNGKMACRMEMTFALGE
jgi:3-hydroxyacyl-[acyl-carrier-protein] dehydratase